MASWRANARPGISPFAAEDFGQLALSLRQVLANHDVAPGLRASLIEDVMFHFAVFIDERIGSDFHESIFALLRRRARQLAKAAVPADSLVADVEIAFRKGRKAELNVLRSCLAKPALLRLNLEIALGVRDTTEIQARVDVEQRFVELMKRKGGVAAVRFRSAANAGKSSWQAVTLKNSPFGNFEQNVKGLLACIRAVTRP